MCICICVCKCICVYIDMCYVCVWVCICTCLCSSGLPFLQTHISSPGMPSLGLYLHLSQDPYRECPYPKDVVIDPCSRSEELWIRDNTTQREPAADRASGMPASSAVSQ